jgi:mevalonate kinase
MLGDISVQARTEMLQANWPAVGDLMNIHQGILDGFGVNTPQLANLIFAARSAGALGAKLSGAGGGDCMFALVESDNAVAVASGIEQAGGLPVKFAPHAVGVRIET